MNNRCNNCGRDLVIKILEAGVSRVCPGCGPAYFLAKTVSNSRSFSPEIQGIATIVCGGLLVGAALIYGDKIISYLSKK